MAGLIFCTRLLSAQTVYWTGGGNGNWSDPADFGGQMVGPSSQVVFGAGGTLGAPSQIDNGVDRDFAISTLGYCGLTSSGYHTTFIAPGCTLSIVPQAPQLNALAVGSWANTGGPAQGGGANDQVYASIVGTNGTLLVYGLADTIRIEQDQSNSGAHNATLDMSGLGTFSAAVSNILIGADGGQQRDVGTLILAQTNFITTAPMGTNVPGILLGRAMTDGGYGVMTLGRTNLFCTDWLAVGGYRANQSISTLGFGSGITNGAFVLRGSAGGRAALLSIGDNQANETGAPVAATGRSPVGNVDLRGGRADVLVDAIYVGRNPTTNYLSDQGATGVGTGTLTYDNGVIDVNNLYLAYRQGLNYGSAVGTVNVSNNAVLNVNTNIILSYCATTAGAYFPISTLNISSNAVVNVMGDIVEYGGGFASINLNAGGLLNLQPAGDPVPGSVTVDALNLNGGVATNGLSLAAATIAGWGSIGNFHEVTNTGSLVLSSGTNATSVSIGANFTLQTNASLNLILNSAGSAASNSYFYVKSNLTFTAGNALLFAPVPPPMAAAYRLADYGGVLMGTPVFTNSTRYRLGVDCSIYGQINLTNGGGGPITLVWQGAAGPGGTNWDLLGMANWSGEPFYQDDSVVFNDTSTIFNINLVGTLYPQTVTVSSDHNYSLLGSGKISGIASVVKNGSGTLFINNSGGNDFSGSIVVNGGILKVGRSDVFGATNGITSIAGGTLDLNGVSCNSSGELVTIAGTGYTNAGAIINSGGDAAGQNGLRYVALSDNASIGNSSGRWDIRGPGGNGSFSAGLNLNGFTLSKTGSGKNALVDAVATNAGSIVVANGVLALTRAKVDGPGAISVLDGATLSLENFSAGYVAKPLVFSGTALLTITNTSSPASTPVIYSPVTNQGSLTIDNAQDVTFTNVFSGTGALIKTSPGKLVLQAPDMCTGPTTVSAGKLVLGAGAGLPNTSSLLLGSGCGLDVSALGGYALGSGRSLQGAGTVTGGVTTGAGCTLGAGPSVGTLTISGDLSLTSSTLLVKLGDSSTQIGTSSNDLIRIGHDLTLNGITRIQVSALAPLSIGVPYTIAYYTNALHGGLANLSASIDNPRLQVQVVDPATTPNQIQILIKGVPTTLTWHGGQIGNPTVWDNGTTPNWLNGGTADVFYPGDSVVLDDSAVTNLVTLMGRLAPSSIQVNNQALAYTFGGAGGLDAGSLIKHGSGLLTLTNSGTNNFTLGIELDAGTLALNFPGDASLNSAFSDDGSGNGILSKLGTNIVTLGGNSANFNGQILVNAGTLKIGGTNALGNANGATWVAAGATLDINSANLGAEPITISGAGVGGLGALVNNSASDQQDAVQNVILAGDATFGGSHRWDIRNRTGTDCFLTTSNQPYKLTKVGPNQVSLVNTTVDPALGDIDVQQGILSLEYSSTMFDGGLGDASHSITVFSNAFLLLNQLNNGLSKPVVLKDGATITNENGDNYIYGTVSLNGSNGFNISQGSLTLNSPLSGKAALNKYGSGALDLWTDNTNFSSAYVDDGNLVLSSSQALGTNLSLVVATTSGGGGQTGTRVTLDGGKSGGVTIPPGVSVTLSSLGSYDLRSMLYADIGVSEWQGPVNFSGDGTVAVVANSPGTRLTISGPMSGTLTNLALRGTNGGFGRISGAIHLGSARLQKTESSTWVLATNNNTWGDTLLSNGRLELGTNNACPIATTITFGEPGLVPILDLNGFDQQLGGIVSAGDVSSDIIANSSDVSDSTLTILGTSATTFGGSIRDTVPVSAGAPLGSRHVGLTLAAGNSGTLTLTNVNTYTGPTLLNGGALLVNGVLSNTVVTVNAGAALGGSGCILGPVTIENGGTLALGPAIGRLAISNCLTFAAGSTNVIKVNLAAAANDMVGGITTLSYGGTLVVASQGQALFTNGTVLKLFDAAIFMGAFSAIVPAQPGAGLAWDTGRLTIDGTLRVVAPVPVAFQQLTLRADRNIHLLASGPTGKAWALYASTNLSLPLTNWTLLNTGLVAASPFGIDDLDATNHPTRFYFLSVH